MLTTILILANIVAITATIIFCLSIEDKVTWEYQRCRKMYEHYVSYTTIYKGYHLQIITYNFSVDPESYVRINSILKHPNDNQSTYYKNTNQAKKAALAYVDYEVNKNALNFIGAI